MVKVKRILQEAEGRVAGVGERCWGWCSRITQRETGEKAEYLDVDIDKWVDGESVYRRSHLITSILGVFFQ